MISVLIPTKNEERDLPDCLRSVSWCDDIHVFDSGSTDSTKLIALKAGANFVSRPNLLESKPSEALFGGDEADHKNWALSNIPFKYEWVFQLDADERVTPQLAANLRQAVAGDQEFVAYRVRRRDFLFDRWLRHVQSTPFYIRLFKLGRLRYARRINPVSIPDGPVGNIEGYLDHFPFSKGMNHWLDRHNSYSTLEALQIHENRIANAAYSPRKAITAPDFNERRFHQKELFYRLPFRPLLKFCLLYFIKRGFLDGRAGFTYATLQAFYEYMIVLKSREAAEPQRVPSESVS